MFQKCRQMSHEKRKRHSHFKQGEGSGTWRNDFQVPNPFTEIYQIKKQ